MSDNKDIHCENDNCDKEDDMSVEESNESTEQVDSSIKLVEEIAELKEALLRKTAELENVRKRLEKEKEDSVKYANKNFARDLLVVLDNFERINAGAISLKEKVEQDANLKGYLDGISLCEKELHAIFKRYGISKIEVSEGDVFNHECHQAMCEIEDNTRPAGSVIQVFQTGYNYNERLLRPAMVSVSKK